MEYHKAYKKGVEEIALPSIVPASTAFGAKAGTALGSTLGIALTGANPAGMYYGGLAGGALGGALGGLAGKQIHKVAKHVHMSTDDKIKHALANQGMKQMKHRKMMSHK